MGNVEEILKHISENTDKICNLLIAQYNLLEQQGKFHLECYSREHSNYKELEYQIQNLEKIVDKHNSKIFALEFYKEQLVSK